MTLLWHNGSFKKDEFPVYMAGDRMRLGECVFNTVLAVDGKLINGEAHFDKVVRNAGVFFGGSYVPDGLDLMKSAHKLLEENKFLQGRYVVNAVISRRGSSMGLKAPEDQVIEILIRAFPAPENFPLIRAVVTHGVRRNEGSPLSNIKCGNYGDNLMALKEAESMGANEAIMLNNKGAVVCATASNIFVVEQGGRLATPPLVDGAQEGVIRGLIIKKLGAVEKRIMPEDLTRSEGIYLTNSVRGALAVKTLNGRDVPTPSLKIPNDFHLS